MVDTINILVRWKLSPEIVRALKEEDHWRSGDWYIEVIRRSDRFTGREYVKLSGRHESLGIQVKGKDGIVEWVQASLPRVLFGYNGRLIVTPFQLEESQERLFEHLAEIAIAEEELIEFTRLDLVLNHPGDPRRIVLAHHNARHPWVRKDDVQYGDHGIRFAGKERVLNLYCKQKERADKGGFDLPALKKSVRVEVQLKTAKAVRDLLGFEDKEIPVGHLDFFQCYRMYRLALCGFDQVIEPPKEKLSLLRLIAECEAQGFKMACGMSAWELYSLGGQAPETLNKARKEMQSMKQTLMAFKWAEILPPYRLPEPVIDVYADGREVEVEGFW